jgi:hypothetical protein
MTRDSNESGGRCFIGGTSLSEIESNCSLRNKYEKLYRHVIDSVSELGVGRSIRKLTSNNDNMNTILTETCKMSWILPRMYEIIQMNMTDNEKVDAISKIEIDGHEVFTPDQAQQLYNLVTFRMNKNDFARFKEMLREEARTLGGGKQKGGAAGPGEAGPSEAGPGAAATQASGPLQALLTDIKSQVSGLEEVKKAEFDESELDKIAAQAVQAASNAKQTVETTIDNVQSRFETFMTTLIENLSKSLQRELKITIEVPQLEKAFKAIRDKYQGKKPQEQLDILTAARTYEPSKFRELPEPPKKSPPPPPAPATTTIVGRMSSAASDFAEHASTDQCKTRDDLVYGDDGEPIAMNGQVKEFCLLNLAELIPSLIIGSPKYMLNFFGDIFKGVASFFNISFESFQDFKEPIDMVYYTLFILSAIPVAGIAFDIIIIIRALTGRRLFLAISTLFTFILSMITTGHIFDLGFFLKLFYALEVQNTLNVTDEDKGVVSQMRATALRNLGPFKSALETPDDVDNKEINKDLDASVKEMIQNEPTDIAPPKQSGGASWPTYGGASWPTCGGAIELIDHLFQMGGVSLADVKKFVNDNQDDIMLKAGSKIYALDVSKASDDSGAPIEGAVTFTNWADPTKSNNPETNKSVKFVINNEMISEVLRKEHWNELTDAEKGFLIYMPFFMDKEKTQ